MRDLTLRRAVLAASLGLLTAVAAPAATYRLDPARSQLVVSVFKGGVAKGLAHDHVVRAGAVAGSVTFDPASPAGAALSITVETGALVADEPALRRARGLAVIDEDDRREIQATMLGKGQLAAASHPRIAFESTAVTALGDGRYRVAGRFTLHGQTRPVTLTATARVDGGTFRAEGSFRFRQSDFGIEPYSAAMGAVKNRDEVELSFVVVAE